MCEYIHDENKTWKIEDLEGSSETEEETKESCMRSEEEEKVESFTEEYKE